MPNSASSSGPLHSTAPQSPVLSEPSRRKRRWRFGTPLFRSPAAAQLKSNRMLTVSCSGLMETAPGVSGRRVTLVDRKSLSFQIVEECSIPQSFGRWRSMFLHLCPPHTAIVLHIAILSPSTAHPPRHRLTLQEQARTRFRPGSHTSHSGHPVMSSRLAGLRGERRKVIASRGGDPDFPHLFLDLSVAST